MCGWCTLVYSVGDWLRLVVVDDGWCACAWLVHDGWCIVHCAWWLVNYLLLTQPFTHGRKARWKIFAEQTTALFTRLNTLFSQVSRVGVSFYIFGALFLHYTCVNANIQTSIKPASNHLQPYINANPTTIPRNLPIKPSQPH